YSLSALFLSLGIMRYYRAPYSLCLPLAVLFAVATGGIVFLLIFRNHRKKTLTKKEQEKRDALMLHLALEKEERVRASLVTALVAEGKNAHCEKGGIGTEDGLIVPRFTMQPLSADEAARLIREYGPSFTIACNALSPEAEKLLGSFGLKAVRGDEIYTLFSRTETTPSPLICGEIPRRTVRQKLRRTFSKTNARPFFVSGLLLLIMSLFTFFPTYYLISGSVLLLCAVTVRIFGYSQ
ncbi:MAG: hypothetical protein ACI4ST_03040, partial [Candidatus Gallimonas sp.]